MITSVNMFEDITFNFYIRINIIYPLFVFGLEKCALFSLTIKQQLLLLSSIDSISISNKYIVRNIAVNNRRHDIASYMLFIAGIALTDNC